LRGAKTAPPFFRRRKNRPPPPSTCNNVYNAESCSTGIPSIYRCSTGLGVESGRAAVLSCRVDTICSAAIDPRVRVCDSLAESANDSQSLFPSNPPVIRINSSPNSYFAPECPTIALTPNMGSTPTRKPQTLCERFWGNLEGIWRGLVEDVGWIVRRTPDIGH
jgi:hypothetical protein